MSKLRVFVGIMAVVAVIGTQASEPSWHEVSSITTKDKLVQANQGGRAALCSWVNESDSKTTLLVGIKNTGGKCGISKLIYSLDKHEPIVTAAEIDLKGFIPRTILRTSSGTLYLVANSGTDSDWLEHWSDPNAKGKLKERLIRPEVLLESLLGGVWISIDDGNNWIELNGVGNKAIMNAGYIACHRPAGISIASNDTVIRVGGAGISSTEITCFDNKESAEQYQKITERRRKDDVAINSRLQGIDSTHYLVISTVFDKIQGNPIGNDPLLTRIGELPINSDGTDSQRSTIRFNYGTNGQGCHARHGRQWTGAIDVGFGTPIFDDYCNKLNVQTIMSKAGRDCGANSNPKFNYHYGDTNVKCFPNGYYYYENRDSSGELKEHGSSNGKNDTKDKYHNCVVTYDNTGLFLTKLTSQNPQKQHVVEAYFNKIDQDLKKPSGLKTFLNPQEVVAQYDGFMAVVTQGKLVHIRKSSLDSKSHPFGETIFDSNNIERVMIAGVNPLDWHSIRNDKERYNGRLIAIGQLHDELRIKLYMQATQPSIKLKTIDDTQTVIAYKITGEPYAKIKYWWQKADNGQFAPLTRNNIDSIVDKGEIDLDKNGCRESTTSYRPNASGKYRLITSAVVGGFYVDIDTEQPNNIGISSEVTDVTVNQAQNYEPLAIINPRFKINNVSTDYVNNQVINVNTGESVYFEVTAVNNSPNTNMLRWHLNDEKEGEDSFTESSKILDKYITFDNEGTSEVNRIVKATLDAHGKDQVVQTFTVTVNPKLITPVITSDDHYPHFEKSIQKLDNDNVCDSSIISLKTTINGDVAWHRAFDSERLPNTEELITGPIHRVLQVISGPALNDDPECYCPSDDWLFPSDWKATSVNSKKDKGYGIYNALQGTTAGMLCNKNLILIDSRCSYLYIAAARNAEDGTKLTLILECYNNKKKKLKNITLPEATLTDTWSSFGAIINGPDKKYPWPNNTTFVKLVINLPASKKDTDGAQVSVIRLVEMPKETIELLNYYNDSLPKTTNDQWSLVNLWDDLVRRKAETHMLKISSDYYAVADKDRQTTQSKTFMVTAWPKIFFTRYSTDPNSILFEPNKDPAEPIVITVKNDGLSRLILRVSPLRDTELTWERAKKFNKDPDWVKDDSHKDNPSYYIIKKFDKNNTYFLRCRAEIKDPDSPCKGSFAYSRVFKIVIAVESKEL